MYLTLEKIAQKLGISVSEILSRRAAGDIRYSEKTDKYDIDSILQQRTMTIGIDKFLTPDQKRLLREQMKSFSKLYMKIFKKMQNGEKFESAGKDRQHRIMAKELGLPQLYADSAMAMASGTYNSLITWTKKYQENLIEEIADIEETLQKLKYSKKKLKQALAFKKKNLEKLLKESKKSVWFGNHKPEDKEKYENSRLSLFVTGTAGKGNKKFGIVAGVDDTYDLNLDGIILPNIKIEGTHKETFSLSGLNRQASRISYNKKGKLVINITYTYIKPFKLDNGNKKSKGTIGIDIGPKEIAVCFVKNDGNPAKYIHYNIGDIQDKRKEEKQRILSNILEEIFDIGIEHGFTHVTIENLKSLKFKKTYNKDLNRMLSKFPKAIFEDLVNSKCARKGLKLKQVYPGNTSLIGIYKYAKRDNLSTGHSSTSKDLSAALAIGRRGLGFKEREVLCFRKKGRTVSYPASSIFLPAEHGDSKGSGSIVRFNFWTKIDLLYDQTLTGISRARSSSKVKTRTLLDSSPARLADIVEMQVYSCRMSAMALRERNAPDPILPF